MSDAGSGHPNFFVDGQRRRKYHSKNKNLLSRIMSRLSSNSCLYITVSSLSRAHQRDRRRTQI